MEPITWAIILIVVGASLIVLELFIPSGGIIGFLSAASFIAAVIMGFQIDNNTGLAILGCALLTSGIMITLIIKYWHQTPIGSRALPPDLRVSEAVVSNLKHLHGTQGISRSDLMPNGEVDIDGKHYDAVSSGTFIAMGSAVQVINVRGNRLLVQAIEIQQATAVTQNKQRHKDNEDAGIDYSVFEENLDETDSDAN
jgi:membrane-bound ClpP family serine protease